MIRRPGARRGEICDRLLEALVRELLSPLTVVRGYADTLRRDADALPRSVVRECLETISRGTEQMSRLVRNVMDAQMIYLGTVDLGRMRADVGALVRQAVDELGLAAKSHVVESSVIDGVGSIVDPIRIRQVLSILLSNAAAYGAEGTPIRIEMRRGPVSVSIHVSDFCGGIPEHRRREMFQMFSGFGAARGTGLGLSIARGLARAHGGDLVLAPGSGPGCRFVLSLPIAT
ncbi:MAG: hypothetical protein HY775_08375 [Acidobacteria bacterium]|nr:hypothetical protein [Acidobacteriota bacterium]